MPRAVVLLPTTSYRAGDFVRSAERLGVDLVVASEEAPPFDMGDRYVQIDCSDPEKAAEIIASLGDEVPLDGVVAADDAGVVVAALAGQRLGLRANSPESAGATRDKVAMRRLLAASEVPQPEFRELPSGVSPLQSVDGLHYPVVVKPRDRSAGQGVVRVDSPGDLEAVVSRVRQISGNTTLLAEEMARGAEVAVEGLLRDGELDVLAVFDKPGQSEGPFFPETILVTPSRLPEGDQEEVLRVAGAATNALGLTTGSVHVELKVDSPKVSVIEVAARSIGGLCSRTLSFGLMGTTLETLILRNAISMDKPELHREPSASGVLMIPIPESGTLREVGGLDEVRAIAGITGLDITIPNGSRVRALPEGDRYLGFVFARGADPETVEQALRKAMEVVDVKVDR